MRCEETGQIETESSWRGFDFNGVWRGDYYDPAQHDSYGVYFRNASGRKMILDPAADRDNNVTESEAEENRNLIQMIGNANKVFLDWTSPWVPVDTPYDQSRDRADWDKELSKVIFDLLNSDPISFFSPTFPERLGRIFQFDIVKFSPGLKLAEELARLNTVGKLRRGDIEAICWRLSK